MVASLSCAELGTAQPQLVIFLKTKQLGLTLKQPNLVSYQTQVISNLSQTFPCANLNGINSLYAYHWI